jgi:hypothetical protein
VFDQMANHDRRGTLAGVKSGSSLPQTRPLGGGIDDGA